MRIGLSLVLALVACARAGPSEGAVAVTAKLAISPAADGEAFTFELASDIEDREIAFDEHHADGTPNRDPRPARVDVYRDTIQPIGFSPIDTVNVQSASRDALAGALAAVKSEVPPGRNVVIERERTTWILRFIDTNAGFELEPGVTAEVRKQADGESSVALSMTKSDATRYEQLTREHLGRRITVVADDEALSTPIVAEPIPNGIVWLLPREETAEDLLARLTR